MEISNEQIQQIKKQLTQQIESSMQEPQKSQALQQINSMGKEQLIEFLKQNKMLQQSEGEQQCIFCSIVKGQMPSYKIAENEKAVAVLDIRPLSRGHILIIPKEHIEKPENIPQEAQELGTQIAGKIQETFNPTKVEVKIANIMGHEVINLIPLYEGKDFNEKREPASEKELKEIQSKLSQIKEEKTIKKEIAQDCLFCSIVQNKTPSVKLSENEKAVAVLDITPIARGHSIIIPKEHVKKAGDLPSQAQTLSKQIAKKINSKLKPKDVQIITSNAFGHEIINVLPIYTNETMASERTQVNEEDLKELQKLISIKPRKEKKRKEKKKQEKKEPWLPRRLP